VVRFIEIDSFNFKEQKSVNEPLIRELLRCEFVDNNGNADKTKARDSMRDAGFPYLLGPVGLEPTTQGL
jgi:hypothetical protein